MLRTSIRCSPVYLRSSAQWPEYDYNFFKVNFLRANQLESDSREIYQGNPELDTGNRPQTQQMDWFLKLA